MRRFLRVVALCAAAALGACHHATMSDPDPVAGHVTDMVAFNTFIATHPTPERFRRAYPDVVLILPGQIATREFRMNNSRYFAELDKDGRITGGKFM